MEDLPCFIISVGLLSRFIEIFGRFFPPKPGAIKIGCVSYFYISASIKEQSL